MGLATADKVRALPCSAVGKQKGSRYPFQDPDPEFLFRELLESSGERGTALAQLAQ